MASIPLVAIEAPTGTTGSDGLAVFTFPADIDTVNHRIVVDRLEQGNTIDYTVTATRQVTFAAGSIPVLTAKIWLFNGVAGVTIATGSPNWKTVAELISDAAIELGLLKAPVADPFASTDANILQLVAMLKSGGRALAKHRDWTHLQKEYTFAMVAGVQTYPLPSDYRTAAPDTEWNRSARFPVAGPLTGQQRQALRARAVISGVTTFLSFWLGQIVIENPADGQTVALEYQSWSFIRPNGQQSPTSDTPTVATDVVCMDPTLVVTRLKRDFRRNKKQDSQSEQDDYSTALAAAEREDAIGRTIYIGGRLNRMPKLLDRWNLPDTIG